ncbi:MAG: MATE family efflux transporter [Oscillospiraceae bacterium]
MKTKSTDMGFYKSLLFLAIPIAMQNLITVAVSMMDTVMLGKLGDTVIAASSLANQLFFVLTILLFGVSGGAHVLISQFWGKGDIEKIKRVFAIMYRIAILLALLFTVIAIFFPMQAMSVFSTDAGVIEAGASYLKIVGFSYVLFALTSSTIITLRSVGTVRISVIVYSVSLVVNTVLNAIFIFGLLGFPAMGIQGAAIATLISRMVELMIIAIFLFKIEDKIRLRFSDLMKAARTDYLLYLNASLPIIGNELVWALGNMTTTIIIGRMGTEIAAASSITTVVFQFVTVFAFGISSGSGVMIGNTIGAGEYEIAKKRSRGVIVLAIILGLISAIFMFILRPFAINFYDVSELARAAAFEIMASSAICMVFQVTAVVSMMGILRSGGDNRFVLVADTIFLWLFAIPLGFLAAFVFHLPVGLVYLCLKSDEILKVLFSIPRVFKGKWINDVTKQ